MKRMECVYPYSYEEALRLGEQDVKLYNESYELNIKCADAVKTAIDNNYRDNRLNSKAAVEKVVKEYGYNRLNHVLANTIRRMEHDGRISLKNKEWAKSIEMVDDKTFDGRDRRIKYIVKGHSGLLDIFTSEALREYNSLGFYGEEHCIPAADLDFQGKLMVLKPENLNMEHKKPDFQLVYCTGGFGCSHNARGRKVFGEFLKDGEECQFERMDFIGELCEKHMPEWAKKSSRIRFQIRYNIYWIKEH